MDCEGGWGLFIGKPQGLQLMAWKLKPSALILAWSSSPIRNWRVDCHFGKHRRTQVPNRQPWLGIKTSNKIFKTGCMWRLGSCMGVDSKVVSTSLRPFIKPRAAFLLFLLKRPQPRLLKWFRAASPQQAGTILHDYSGLRHEFTPFHKTCAS